MAPRWRVAAGLAVLAAVVLAGCQAAPGTEPVPELDPTTVAAAQPTSPSGAAQPAVALPLVAVGRDTGQLDLPGLPEGVLGRFVLDVQEAPDSMGLVPKDFSNGTAESGYGYVLWDGLAPAWAPPCASKSPVVYAFEGQRLFLEVNATLGKGLHEVWVWQHGVGPLHFVFANRDGQGEGQRAVTPVEAQWLMPTASGHDFGPQANGRLAVEAAFAMVSSTGSSPTTDQADWSRSVVPIASAGACPGLEDAGTVTVVGAGTSPPRRALIAMGDLTAVDYDLAWTEGPAAALLPGEPGWQLTVLAFTQVQ